jgi:hypothetical protein
MTAVMALRSADIMCASATVLRQAAVQISVADCLQRLNAERASLSSGPKFGKFLFLF